MPLFQSPVLARALFFTTELEGFIPEPLEAVAQVIAYIFNINSINQSNISHARPVPRVPDEMVFDLMVDSQTSMIENDGALQQR